MTSKPNPAQQAQIALAKKKELEAAEAAARAKEAEEKAAAEKAASEAADAPKDEAPAVPAGPRDSGTMESWITTTPLATTYYSTPHPHLTGEMVMHKVGGNSGRTQFMIATEHRELFSFMIPDTNVHLDPFKNGTFIRRFVADRDPSMLDQDTLEALIDEHRRDTSDQFRAFLDGINDRPTYDRVRDIANEVLSVALNKVVVAVREEKWPNAKSHKISLEGERNEDIADSQML